MEPGGKGKGSSAAELWKNPHQCCFIHSVLFKSFRKARTTKRAGDLAMEMLKNHHEKSRSNSEGEEDKVKNIEKDFTL